MDARCAQVYTALFAFENGELVRLTEDAALRLEELSALLREYNRPVLFLGDGTDVVKTYYAGNDAADFRVAPEIYKYQHASGVAFAAAMRYNKGDAGESGETLQPSYLRLPQAERERIKGEKKK